MVCNRPVSIINIIRKKRSKERKKRWFNLFCRILIPQKNSLRYLIESEINRPQSERYDRANKKKPRDKNSYSDLYFDPIDRDENKERIVIFVNSSFFFVVVETDTIQIGDKTRDKVMKKSNLNVKIDGRLRMDEKVFSFSLYR